MSYASSSAGAHPAIPEALIREHISVLKSELAQIPPHEPRRRQLEEEIRIVQLQIQPPAPPPPPPLPAAFYNAVFPQQGAYRSMSGGSTTASSGRNCENWSWNGDGSRKRQCDSPGGIDRTKSPRFAPSPATTFANTPASGSPAKEILSAASFVGLDDYSYLDQQLDGSGTNHLSSDEEFARMLQQQYDNGWSPPKHEGKLALALPRIETDSVPKGYENMHFRRPKKEPGSPSPFGGYRRSDVQVFGEDSEEEAGSEKFTDAESEGSGSRSDLAVFPKSLVQPQTLSNEDFSREVGFNPALVQASYLGFNSGNDAFGWLQDPFVDIPAFNASAEMPAILDTSNQIIDTRGNIVLNGGWEMPGVSSYSASPNMMSLPDSVQDYASWVRNDPTKTHQEIRSLLENIRPDMEIPPENREGTPDAMVYPLMEHQKLGLAWLKKMEESTTKGGILADDMGLGKTIQALALIVSRPSTDPKRKTTLIIAPVALLKQWQSEIQKKLRPDYQLSTYIHHGNGKKSKNFEDLAKYDVVLTTYGTIASEFKQQERHKDGTSPVAPKLVMLAKDAKWYRVILDESQWIKTRTVQCSKGCAKLNSIYRLCLSGTPMQNSCDELYPLLRFLRIKPYSEWDSFSSSISRPLKNKSSISVKHAMARLQALLSAILLRRTKDSKIDDKPILCLPPKTVEVVHAVFSAEEQEFYSMLESRSKIQFNKYLRANAVGKNYSNVLVLLLRLRQACCHPHLISDIEEPSSNDGKSMMVIAKELPDEAVSRIKEEMGNSECPVCLDVSENPSIIIPCGHLFCSECLVKVQTQHTASLAAQGEGAGASARCPGCRGELDMNKIIDLNTFKSIFQLEDLDNDTDKLLADLRPDDGLIYDTDSDAEDDDNDVNERGDLKDFVVPDDEDDEAEEQPKPKKAKTMTSEKSKGKGKKKAGVGRTLAEIRKDAMRNEKSKRRYHKYLASRWVDSAKVTKCMEILENVRTKDDTEKTIIFSQFTSLLDLLEVPMTKAGIAYRRYDGGMSSAKRDQSIEDFSYEDDVKVLLVSLKAGNSGLNLVSASQVIIFDPFYNPFVELQAIDRAHRIGQQRPVTVHRLIVEDTVEDRVLMLQEKKRELIEGALDENAQRGIGRLSEKDLGFLFGF